MQTTSHLLMIRPVNFGFNAETAVNNAFQVAGTEEFIQQKALKEFDDFVALLRLNGVDVTVVDDKPEPHTPDSIFPNNWVSFHEDGTLCLYPMFAENRRRERNPHILDLIAGRFKVLRTIDFSHYENEKIYLEGTGSMVLDRDKKIAYACLSPRTDFLILIDFCEKLGYRAEVFDSVDNNARPIYHTNVMMCVADKYIVICLESIPAEHEKNQLIQTIKYSDKELVTISLEQMNHFAGNMLQVNNSKGEKLLIMSTQAFESLNPGQVILLSSFNKIIHSKLNTIETNGGGSARCMMAEIHLPPISTL
jgi:hypothetical protein